jgi:hypothetical protein
LVDWVVLVLVLAGTCSVKSVSVVLIYITSCMNEMNHVCMERRLWRMGVALLTNCMHNVALFALFLKCTYESTYESTCEVPSYLGLVPA